LASRAERVMRFVFWSHLAAGLLAVAAAQAHAFDIGGTPIREYFDATTGHYTLEVPSELQAQTGIGMGVPTGYGFTMSAACSTASTTFCRRMSRFHGTPGLGPKSYFFTADPDEIAILNRPGSGWTFDGLAFEIDVPNPATGTCFDPAIPFNNGFYGVPVHRFYNNGAPNGANHRYVVIPSAVSGPGVFDRMLAEGWVHEGVRFCAQQVIDGPLSNTTARVLPVLPVRSLDDCERDANITAGCLGVHNVAVPSFAFGPFLSSPSSFSLPAALSRAAGRPVYWLISNGGATPADAAAGTFIALDPAIQLVAPSGPLSSVTVMYRPALYPDGTGLIFPWAPIYESPVQLTLGADAWLRRQAIPDGSEAYGHSTTEFVDASSGRKILFNVLAFGTMPLSDDPYVARDVRSGEVIIGIRQTTNSPFLRGTGCTVGRSEHFIDSDAKAGVPCGVFFHMNATEFQRVVDAARTIDPQLSPSPANYFVGSHRFKVEIAGMGFVNLWGGWPSVTLVRQ
jgi:hypothetical protein